MTPGHNWMAAKFDKSRASIYRALRIDPKDTGAFYAIGPFRIMHDADNTPCIGGAVGFWPAFDKRRIKAWTPDDISDVILWNPVTGNLSLAGQSGPELILPYEPEPRLTIYADGYAFFRAWADNRAATFARIQQSGVHALAGAEPADSGLPGALVIGDLNKIDWCQTGASVLVAGPGVDPKKLNTAIIRSARLPRVEAA